MEKLKLYLETTVFNYYFDDREGHDDVIKLFEAIAIGRFEVYTSRYAVDELLRAADPKRAKMLALIEKYGIKEFPVSEEAERLASLYISEKIIPAKFFDDAVHIAIASVHKMDFVLSYNFTHINRVKAKLLTAETNRREGYKAVEICEAWEVLNNG